jgi:hypothetical protein
MSPPVLLRTASALTLLFAAGHAMGAVDFWSPPGETTVLEAMRSFQFDVMGTTRTYLDFYLGFGLYITVLLLLQAILLWQLAAIAKKDPAIARPLIVAFLATSVVGTFVIWRFIFIVPAAFSLACAACLVAALATSHRLAEKVR